MWCLLLRDRPGRFCHNSHMHGQCSSCLQASNHYRQLLMDARSQATAPLAQRVMGIRTHKTMALALLGSPIDKQAS